jgi:hypothetical protein
MGENQGFSQDYMNTLTTFSGADIVATFGSTAFGELQAITYAVKREIAPIYTLGSAAPRSFSRGKRGISGSLVFINFNRHALLATLYANLSKAGLKAGFTARGNLEPWNTTSIDRWNEITSPTYVPQQTSGTPSAPTNTTSGTGSESGSSDVFTGSYAELTADKIKYLDQFPPFDITISFANEFGATSSLKIYGIQILDEGGGMSVDDMVIEKACSFVARDVDPMGWGTFAAVAKAGQGSVGTNPSTDSSGYLKA